MHFNAHPLKFSMDIIGILISFFYMWSHEIYKAFLIGGVIILIGTFIAVVAFKIEESKVAASVLGKAYYRLSIKKGFACYITFYVLAFTACWLNEIILFLPAILSLFIGLIIHRTDILFQNHSKGNKLGQKQGVGIDKSSMFD